MILILREVILQQEMLSSVIHDHLALLSKELTMSIAGVLARNFTSAASAAHFLQNLLPVHHL